MKKNTAILATMVIFLSVFVMSDVDTVFSMNGREKQADSKITLNLKNEPLNNVINKVAQQTTSTIKISEKLAPVVVTGTFVEEPFDSFFRRILKGHNVSIIYDVESNSVTIRFFGEKGTRLVTASGQTGETGYPVIDPVTGMTMRERREIERKQLEALAQFKNDPESIDPMSGKTMGERREIERNQLAALEEFRNDPDSVDPSSGKTMVERREIERNQLAALEEFRNDPDSVDPSSGKTMVERREIERKQLETLARFKEDSSSVDPLSGKTMAELRRIEKKQAEILANAKK